MCKKCLSLEYLSMFPLVNKQKVCKHCKDLLDLQKIMSDEYNRNDVLESDIQDDLRYI